MHAIVGVIHNKDVDVETNFYRFLYDNDEMYEEYERIEEEEIPKLLEDWMNELKERGTQWATERYEQLEMATFEQRLEMYADDYGYQVDGRELVQYGNPHGECDWFVIGGRWAGSLVDFQGNTADSMKIDDINPNADESLEGFYGIWDLANDMDYIEYEDYSDISTKLVDVVAKAKEQEEKTGEELYLTLVDIHQ